MRPHTRQKATTFLRKHLPAVYAVTVVYTAALCGWQLNGNTNPVSILLHIIILASATFLTYALAKERENQQ